jgi:hypothetical protein
LQPTIPRRIKAKFHWLVAKLAAIWSATGRRSRVHIDKASTGRYRSPNQIGLVQLIPSSQDSGTSGAWRAFAALLLIIAALGLPINDLFRYALLVIAAVVILTGEVSSQPKAWLRAIAGVMIAALGMTLFPAPRIEEGHNVFIVDGRGGALERGLPSEVFAFMQAAFDAQYPPERRCNRNSSGCWRGQGVPDRVHAFSADGIYDRSDFSRRVTDIDFDDAVWHRLGFVNDVIYNWYGTVSDLDRASRLRGADLLRNPWQALFHQWRLTMPWFAVYRFPVDFVGSRLCWTGDVLWEEAPEKFIVQRHTTMECRTIETLDVGMRIFGVAIAKDAPLTMRLQPGAMIRLRQMVEPMLALIGVCGVLGFLVRWRARGLVMPLVLVGAALVVVTLNDASFIGGWRPFDSGDDGLFYEGVGRKIVQYLLAGDYSNALRGEESVFFYGGPGLRYFRALELLVVGDTNLGYLSLMLTLPALAYGVFLRFLPLKWAMAMIIIFVAIPIGGLFGSSYFLYIKWAARGFADPAAAVFFLAGMLLLLGRTQHGPDGRFAPALGAGLMFYLALFVRPNLAPIAGVLLGGAGVVALWQVQYRRLAGMCLGFLPVASMALHNWYFGDVFVLFSSNAFIAEALPMPPSAYVAALGELLRLDLSGGNLSRGALQLARWLAGPSESFMMVPVHAVAIVVAVRVAFWGRDYDPWLRLTAWAALAGHPMAFFYLSYPRYHFLTWFLTLVVCAVWMRIEGLDLLRHQFPGVMDRFARHPITAALQRALDWCVRTTHTPRVHDSKISAAV